VPPGRVPLAKTGATGGLPPVERQVSILSMTNPAHRKTIRHFDDPSDCHELTFSCYGRQPLLNCDDRCKLLSKAIDTAVGRLGFSLVAFVYMPEHIHLLVWPKIPGTEIADLLFAIKRPFSFRVKQRLQASGDPLLQRLTIRERPGKMSFRFWQEGPGYDRNLFSLEAAIAAAEYIHNNPVRRGLRLTPGEWKWSSWRYYHLPNQAADPDLPRIDGFPLG
jgi:putative transposase